MPAESPSQTVGPFFHDALAWPAGEVLAGPEAAGEPIEVAGRVLDGDGLPVPDALVEIWQADGAGRYADHPDTPFRGFGRCATGPDGAFRFLTIRPGPVPGPDGSLQAPHVVVGLFARGLLRRLLTRIYFADAPENASDPVLALVADPARRATLLARREPGERPRYRFDVVLQGRDETVFFDC